MTQTSATRRLRQVLVLMHLMTAIGWLALCAAMLLLTVHGMGLDDQAARRGVFAVVAHLDDNLLADVSFMTVYTGLMLAGLTPWGYTRFWWVTVKLVLAIGCARRQSGVRPVARSGERVGAPGSRRSVGMERRSHDRRDRVHGMGRPRQTVGPDRARPPAGTTVGPPDPVGDRDRHPRRGLRDRPALRAVPAAIVLGHHARHTLLARR